MKDLRLIIAGVVLVGGIVFFSFFLPRRETPPSADVPAKEVAEVVLEGQEKQAESVTVTVAPQPILEGAAYWDFGVTFNTHSVELSDDLTRVATLTDERGKEYAPLTWEGDAPGGHHREGILRFSPIVPLPQKIELTFDLVVAPFSFSWQLQ